MSFWLALAAAGGSRLVGPAMPMLDSPVSQLNSHFGDGIRRLQLGMANVQLQLSRCVQRVDGFFATRIQGKHHGELDAGNDISYAYAFVADSASSDPAWDLKLSNENLRVWRRAVPGSHFDEVRGNGIIDAPPETLISLLCANDPDVIRLYNPLYAEGHDVCQIDKRTRLSYAVVRAFFPLKPRDTLTRVTLWELPLLGAGGQPFILTPSEDLPNCTY